MNAKVLKEKVADQLEDINRVKSRLKFLNEVYRMGESGLYALEAFADMTNSILTVDIEVLNDVEDCLKGVCHE